MQGDIREEVKKTYAKAIKSKSCCSGGSSGCCGGLDDISIITSGLYKKDDLQGLPADLIKTSFGCGNPTALEDLSPGERVLDLGSGAGLDVLISARRVGPSGKAFGLDMTEEMLEEARANQRKAGIENVEFLKGHLEDIPLPDNEVDVIISNCVINLSPDKDKALREAFRVLKSGGRFAISDIVFIKPVPNTILNDITVWAGCIAGALTIDEYRKKLESAGFGNVSIEVTRTYDFTNDLAAQLLPNLSKKELEAINGSIASAFVKATKPKCLCSSDRDYQIRPALPGDEQEILSMLKSADLTTMGVHGNMKQFIVADNGEIMGAIGIVSDDESSVLLRSLVVKDQFRNKGIADCLLAAALQSVKQSAKTAFLLTNTAEQYFAKRGYTNIERNEIPCSLLEKSLQGVACSSCNTCMKLDLN